MENNPGTGTEKDLRKLKREKLAKLIAMGVEPYKYRFSVTCSIGEVKKRYADVTHEKTKEKVTVAGRIMGIRIHGKAGFADVLGQDDKIQAYFRMNDLGEQKFEIFKMLEVGDIIGLTGPVFRTKMGEVTIWVEEFDLLTKCLLPFPEKYHGLQNLELRYRQRYLDLIVNPEVRKTFIMRSRIISYIRSWLDKRGYIEVETPILQPIYGGALARPFKTHHNYLDMDLYLRIAPELYLKRISVGGLEKIYEIGKNFRNEDIDAQHNPEYTSLELYESYSDYYGMMNLTENLVCDLIKELIGDYRLPYGDKVLDFTPPWRRITMADAIAEYGKVEVRRKTKEEIYDIAVSLGVPDVTSEMSKGELIGEIFDFVAQKHLINPTFILNHPADISPLARRLKEDPDFSERFELFINGWEIANAFTELTDPDQQLQNFNCQAEMRARGNEEAHPIDMDFITALECGLPPTGGLGIGIDRLVMVLTNSPSIKDVIFFPQMRQTQQVMPGECKKEER
jgi:lysyl-tRNA synthetase class 2